MFCYLQLSSLNDVTQVVTDVGEAFALPQFNSDAEIAKLALKRTS